VLAGRPHARVRLRTNIYLGLRDRLQQSTGFRTRAIATETGVSLAEHIVIVDDDELLRSRLAAYLTSQGFRVTTAEGAAKFRDIMARDRIDLALVDITMPERTASASRGSCANAPTSGS
jgi:PleD family two-component response regulator